MMNDWNGEGPLPQLFSQATDRRWRTATGAVNTWECWVEDDEICIRWGRINGTLQNARIKCLPKNAGRSNVTTAHEQAIKVAKIKWYKRLKKKYSESL